jgi:putative phage-type endonuclease
MPNVVYVDQGTPEWFAARLGRATASRFSDVMSKIKSGESAQRKNYRAQLVAERLTGARDDGFSSVAMLWGTETEPLARLRYSLKTGNEVEECGFYAHETLMAGASPDGLIGEDGTLEIKCPNSATHIETLRKQTVPTQYYWQIMGQLWMTNRKWCDFVSFDPRMPMNAQFFTIRVVRDEERINELAHEVESFLKTVELDIAFIKNYKG